VLRRSGRTTAAVPAGIAPARRTRTSSGSLARLRSRAERSRHRRAARSLRLGEVLGLPWTNVNLDAAEVGVSWQLQRVGKQLRHRETKTPGSDAPLPLPAICIAALKLQTEKQADSQRAAGQVWKDTGLVITTRKGRPYEPRNFTRHFASRCTAAGVRYITPHGMRWTCASLLAALDVHPRVATRILRHSKIAVTMEIYTEVPDQAAREALGRLGEQFDN
jgi:integrase